MWITVVRPHSQTKVNVPLSRYSKSPLPPAGSARHNRLIASLRKAKLCWPKATHRIRLDVDTRIIWEDTTNGAFETNRVVHRGSFCPLRPPKSGVKVSVTVGSLTSLVPKTLLSVLAVSRAIPKDDPDLSRDLRVKQRGPAWLPNRSDYCRLSLRGACED